MPSAQVEVDQLRTKIAYLRQEEAEVVDAIRVLNTTISQIQGRSDPLGTNAGLIYKLGLQLNIKKSRNSAIQTEISGYEARIDELYTAPTDGGPTNGKPGFPYATPSSVSLLPSNVPTTPYVSPETSRAIQEVKFVQSRVRPMGAFVPPAAIPAGAKPAIKPLALLGAGAVLWFLYKGGLT